MATASFHRPLSSRRKARGVSLRCCVFFVVSRFLAFVVCLRPGKPVGGAIIGSLR